MAPLTEEVCNPPKVSSTLIARVNHRPDNLGMSSAPLVQGPIGQPLRRKEDARLLRGQGRFSDDFALPGQVYAAMVRSPHMPASSRSKPTRRGPCALADALRPLSVTDIPLPATPYALWRAIRAVRGISLR